MRLTAVKQIKGLASFSIKVSAAADVGALDFRKRGINLSLLIERSCSNIQSECYLIFTEPVLKLRLLVMLCKLSGLISLSVK